MHLARKEQTSAIQINLNPLEIRQNNYEVERHLGIYSQEQKFETQPVQLYFLALLGKITDIISFETYQRCF